MRHEIIMPALGMTQDTGLIVSWEKKPGERVGAEDVLLEVETDKSTMEVPAGHDGYLAEVYAQAGEDVPVGHVIAIVTKDEPAQTVSTSHADGGGQGAQAQPDAADETEATAPREPAPAPDPAPQTAIETVSPPSEASPHGRILASPKARRLAKEQGLDLTRLVAAGYPQPFHVKDLETLRALPHPSNAPTAASGARRLAATVPALGFSAFCDWYEDETGAAPDIAGVIAAMAAAALGAGGRQNEIHVAVERFGQARQYTIAPTAWLEFDRTESAPDAAALIVRDLRHSALTHIALGGEALPVLTLTRADAQIAITLECASEQLTAPAALTLIDEFARRLGDPLSHLL